MASWLSLSTPARALFLWGSQLPPFSWPSGDLGSTAGLADHKVQVSSPDLWPQPAAELSSGPCSTSCSGLENKQDTLFQILFTIWLSSYLLGEGQRGLRGADSNA